MRTLPDRALEERTTASDIGQNGFVELKSGRWYWTSVSSDDGMIVSFTHTGWKRDEMKTWLDHADAGGIVDAARNSVYRKWQDHDGVLWLTGLEFASLRNDSETWITFRTGVSELMAPMPPNTALGDLTFEDLVNLLKSAR